MTLRRSNHSNAMPRGAQPGRRARRCIGAAAVVFLAVMLQQLGSVAATGFEFGDAIHVVVNPDDSLMLSFYGGYSEYTEAVAISFQQCSGSQYLNMDVLYNGTSLLPDTEISNSQCVRVVGGGASVGDYSLGYSSLCTFKDAADVKSGYTEQSAILNGTIVTHYVDPSYVTVALYNGGTVAASAQLVMFSDWYPAPDVAIERVDSDEDRDGNAVTIDLAVRTSGPEDQTFCPSDEGCALYAYYHEIIDDDPYKFFTTSCQASEGTKAYVGSVEDEGSSDDDNLETASLASASTRATTAFAVTACIELPKNTIARYMVYVVLSPDTSSYARVGYGLQDQLIYYKEIIVSEEADIYCPDVEVESEEDSSGALRTIATPVSASGAMAMGLAAAAARAGF